MPEDLSVFSKNYLVSGLADDAVQKVAGLADFKTLVAGEDLIRLNEQNSDLYVILEGKVHVMSASGDKLAEAGPGSILGEVALVDDGPRSANAYCPAMVKVARIPAKELRSFMNSNRDIGFVMLANLSRVMSSRLRNADRKIDDMMANPVDPWKHAT